MFNVEVVFRYRGKPKESAVSEGVWSLLGAWINSGQVLDGEWPLTFAATACRAVVGCPERTALAPPHANKWVRKALADLERHGVQRPAFRSLGKGLASDDVDPCRRPPWLILAINYLSCESPLRCGEHYLPVPLYRIATEKRSGDYYDLHCWEATWKACDRLQMLCGPGERFATRELSRHDSKLAEMGRGLCRDIERQSRIPTYYYLYRYGGRSLAGERRRACPSCGGEWLLDRPLHGLFDLKCNRCRLLSNVSWAFRSSGAGRGRA